MYFAPGAMHAPHHAPKKWRDQFKGSSIMGWEKYREIVYKNQLEMGIIPAGHEAHAAPRLGARLGLRSATIRRNSTRR